ncbi:MAG: SPOR domain-containing protein, partial [Treponemataceae bacterium]|nr:SPOR domain-containing protein [Treponemataceae bacterium]
TDAAPRAADEPDRYDDDVDAYLDDLAESLLGERVFAEELPDSDDVVATEFPPDALDEIDVADFDPDTDDDIADDEVEYVFDDLADADEEIAADEEEYVFDDFTDEDEEIAYEFVWYDDYDSASESPIEEEYLRDDVAPAFEDVARSEKFTADIDREHTDSEAADEAKPQADSDAYQSIVLVPAPENPPEDGENPADDPASVVPIVVVPEQSPSGMEAYLVPSLRDLQDGAYYVQISTLSDRENIEAVLDTYAETYPMVIVPLASGAAYQLLIGPLSVDEYGTVLEKFKAFGFHDAFLRKVKASRSDDPK